MSSDPRSESPLSKLTASPSGPNFDPSQSYLTPPRSGLSAVFQPRGVCVIGATERPGSVGRTTLQNIIDANEGNFSIYPVNPTRDTILDLKAYKSVNDIPSTVDLAIIVTPAKIVTKMVEECGAKGVGAVVVISAGFKEVGEEGQQMERDLVIAARKHGVRLVGPNCLGVMQPNFGLNATFASTVALKGSLAFASQSGAMCTAVLDWSRKEKVGFSSFLSIGSMADVGWGDIIDYLGDDPQTECILIYMETIGDASAFLSAAKEVCTQKPIIVIKAGKSDAAAKAAASHTGSLAGSHGAFLAAMRRVGVMVVDTIGELFNCALALGKVPRPTGPNLLIVSNAGGPGVLATDAVELAGGKIAPLPEPLKDRLNEFLPAAWSHNNPVDILGDASAELYAKTLEYCIDDPTFNGILVILSPQSVTEPTGTAKALVKAATAIRKKYNGVLPKPIYGSWMGGKEVEEGFDMLNHGGIPTYAHPDAAARTFASIWHNTYDQQLMSETPGCMAAQTVPPNAEKTVREMIDAARRENRNLLTEAESKLAMKAFGIPIAETIVCKSPDAAVEAAKSVKYPCVVKLNSETITHKTDVGGVKLDIRSDEAVRTAFKDIEEAVNKIGPHHFQGVTVQPMLDTRSGIELLLGSYTDDQIGPLIAFGSGGCMVEIYKDTSISLPPLNATLAARQIEDTKIYAALKGGQGERFPGCPLDELSKTLVAFSHMVVEMVDDIAEIDINPILALRDRIVALDARVVLRDLKDPKVPLAIRPYPTDYVLPNVELKNGLVLKLRPSHHNDFQRFVKFHKDLSSDTIRQRYLSEVSLNDRVAHQKVHKVCAADYSRFIGLLAVDNDEKDEDMHAIARITRFPTRHDIAEFKLAVSDELQGQGLGAKMVEHCQWIAKRENLAELRAIVLDQNKPFLALMNRFGFKVKPTKIPNLLLCKWRTDGETTTPPSGVTQTVQA